MTRIEMSLLADISEETKQLGNHVFARNADLVSVYEVISYEGYKPKTLKDLEKTYLITRNDTWDTVANRFFGAPQAPDFSKVFNNEVEA